MPILGIGTGGNDTNIDIEMGYCIVADKLSIV